MREEPETYVVGTATPFQSTFEVKVNWVPVTISVNAELLAAIDDGERKARVGTGFCRALMVKMSAFDVPPPGAGFCTVMVAEPAKLRAEAGIWAIRVLLDTKVVGTAAPFHKTVEVDANCVPATVRANADPPAAALAGEREVIAGTGFWGTFMVKVIAFDVPPPGVAFCTVTKVEPAVLNADAGICAVSELGETKVVGAGAPLKRTVEEGMKLLPEAARGNAELAAKAEFGLREVRVGTGFKV